MYTLCLVSFKGLSVQDLVSLLKLCVYICVCVCVCVCVRVRVRVRVCACVHARTAAATAACALFQEAIFATKAIVRMQGLSHESAASQDLVDEVAVTTEILKKTSMSNVAEEGGRSADSPQAKR